MATPGKLGARVRVRVRLGGSHGTRRRARRGAAMSSARAPGAECYALLLMCGVYRVREDNIRVGLSAPR